MLLNLAYRNIFRNVKRSLISMTSVGVVSMGLILFFAFSDGFNESLKTSLKNYISGDFYISNKKFKDYADINPLGFLLEESLVRSFLEENPDLIVNPILETMASVYKDGSFQIILGVMGIEFNENTLDKIFIKEGRYPIYNSQEPTVREIVLGDTFAKINNLHIGDEIVLLSSTATGSTNAMNFTIVGLVDYGVENFNVGFSAIPLELAQRFLFAQGYVTRYLVYVEKESLIPQALESFEEYLLKFNLEESLSVLPWYETEVMPFLKVKNINANIMAALFFILGSIVIANTTLMTVLERRKEIGVIRALGMSKGEVRALFFIESFLIGIIGSIFGMILGAILTIPFSYWGIDITPGISENGGKVLGPSEIYFLVTYKGVLTVTIFSIVINFFISYFSTIRATKISPRESMGS